jgi:hypothetical protein
VDDAVREWNGLAGKPEAAGKLFNREERTLDIGRECEVAVDENDPATPAGAPAAAYCGQPYPQRLRAAQYAETTAARPAAADRLEVHTNGICRFGLGRACCVC